NGAVTMTIAPEGIVVGQEIAIATTDAKVGNVLKIQDIPEGTPIFNIEGQPGDGGKYVRSSGTSAKIGPKVADGITIIFPSKKKKVFSENCRAMIGVAAGGNRVEKPILKAGNAYYKAKARNHLFPVVSGSAMNAVAHPFGNKRTARKSKNRPIPRNAPPGRKVGNVAARRTGQKKGR
ncbi:MAG: 50S ribosomal protein L2, partial [Thermotogota bacterium]